METFNFYHAYVVKSVSLFPFSPHVGGKRRGYGNLNNSPITRGNLQRRETIEAIKICGRGSSHTGRLAPYIRTRRNRRKENKERRGIGRL